MKRRSFLMGGAASAVSAAVGLVTTGRAAADNQGASAPARPTPRSRTATPATISTPASVSQASATNPPRRYAGPDLDGWKTVVGDGIFANPGHDPVSPNDIATDHFGAYSELRANVQRRGVMAHNITYRPVIDDTALDHLHLASFDFRIPIVPTQDNRRFNAQTVEGGLFIWDGAGDRRDHGLAFQWVLNPWVENFGQVSKWSNSRRGWLNAGWIEPDTEWHRITVELDPRVRLANMMMDDLEIDRVYTRRTKPASWGTETAARLQAEIISVDPGPNDEAPVHAAEFRNWSWDWMP